MKKTRKKNVIARGLSSWAMQLSNYLRYELSWSPDNAMHQAWLCLWALDALGKGVVTLDFVKDDGTRRIARGTLCKGISEFYDSYEYKKRGGIKKTLKGYYNFSFWDLDKECFRSFNAARLNHYYAVKNSNEQP